MPANTSQELLHDLNKALERNEEALETVVGTNKKIVKVIEELIKAQRTSSSKDSSSNESKSEKVSPTSSKPKSDDKQKMSVGFDHDDLDYLANRIAYHMRSVPGGGGDGGESSGGGGSGGGGGKETIAERQRAIDELNAITGKVNDLKSNLNNFAFMSDFFGTRFDEQSGEILEHGESVSQTIRLLQSGLQKVRTDFIDFSSGMDGYKAVQQLASDVVATSGRALGNTLTIISHDFTNAGMSFVKTIETIEKNLGSGGSAFAFFSGNVSEFATELRDFRHRVNQAGNTSLYSTLDYDTSNEILASISEQAVRSGISTRMFNESAMSYARNTYDIMLEIAAHTGKTVEELIRNRPTEAIDELIARGGFGDMQAANLSQLSGLLNNSPFFQNMLEQMLPYADTNSFRGLQEANNIAALSSGTASYMDRIIQRSLSNQEFSQEEMISLLRDMVSAANRDLDVTIAGQNYYTSLFQQAAVNQSASEATPVLDWFTEKFNQAVALINDNPIGSRIIQAGSLLVGAAGTLEAAIWANTTAQITSSFDITNMIRRFGARNTVGPLMRDAGGRIAGGRGFLRAGLGTLLKGGVITGIVTGLAGTIFDAFTTSDAEAEARAGLQGTGEQIAFFMGDIGLKAIMGIGGIALAILGGPISLGIAAAIGAFFAIDGLFGGAISDFFGNTAVSLWRFIRDIDYGGMFGSFVDTLFGAVQAVASGMMRYFTAPLRGVLDLMARFGIDAPLGVRDMLNNISGLPSVTEIRAERAEAVNEQIGSAVREVIDTDVNNEDLVMAVHDLAEETRLAREASENQTTELRGIRRNTGERETTYRAVGSPA